MTPFFTIVNKCQKQNGNPFLCKNKFYKNNETEIGKKVRAN